MQHQFQNYIVAQVSEKINTKCWVWNGTFTRKGYGRMGSGGTYKMMHQWMWEEKYGPVSKGLVLDHTCEVRICCNPDHLEAITNEENIRRGRVGRNSPYRTHCRAGHLRTEENTYWMDRKGKKYPSCRVCFQERYKRLKEDPEWVAERKTPEWRAKVAAYQRKRREDPAYRELCNLRAKQSKDRKKGKQQ